MSQHEQDEDDGPDGGPWAKTSSGDAEAVTTDATGGVAGGDPDLDRDLDDDDED
jgi:hypothetical protein